MGRVVLKTFVMAAVVLLAAVTGCTVSSPHTPSSSARVGGDQVALPPQPSQLCGSVALSSPFHYDGPAGRYSSGKAGLPTYGTAGSDFPDATAGVVLAAGTHSYASYQLSPDTVYYLLPGVHVGTLQSDKGDAFVGGLSGGTLSVMSGNYSENEAIDSNFSDGNQPGVTIEYMTIEKFLAQGNGAAINQNSNTGWTLRYDTLTLNAPGAGMIAGADNTLEHNCMTLNGQYGFQSFNGNAWGRDAMTGGPYNVTVKDNEISYNDTCDFEGTLTNPAIGWSNYNPVPVRYRNPHCGQVAPDGNEGGFKLWQTDGVTIKGNYIHNNWGPGVWADTNNANTTYVGNTITGNDDSAIIEEISYNFSITDNYLADNGWAGGLGNPNFPTPAIYVSESGSDGKFGGVHACPEASCASQSSYLDESIISRNTFVNNGGNVFLWQNSNRFCSAGNRRGLHAGGRERQFGAVHHLRLQVQPAVRVGQHDHLRQSPYWIPSPGLVERLPVVDLERKGHQQHHRLQPGADLELQQSRLARLRGRRSFPEYGSTAPYDNPRGWVIPSQLTFFADDVWSDNLYHGPSTFYAWNQGNQDNPLSWADWTGEVSKGDKCSSAGERQGGACVGPFGQDSGSTYDGSPVSSSPVHTTLTMTAGLKAAEGQKI